MSKFFSLIISLIFVCAASSSFAVPWYEEDPRIKPGIPDYTPSDESIQKGVCCAHISAANVIGYWDAHGLPNLVPNGMTPDQLMQNLKMNYDDVTTDPVKGLTQYFKNKGYENRVTIKNVTSTYDNVLGELKKSEQLILNYTWPVIGGGHSVTIAGWDETDATGGALKQLGFHDPNNPNAHFADRDRGFRVIVTAGGMLDGYG